MTTLTSGGFLTMRAWHRAVLNGEDVILRRTSALEHLQLFNGYLNEKKIDVYAKRQGEFENINYHVVDSFDDIDTIRIGNLLCTTPSRTFNDMLDGYYNLDSGVDGLALIEGLSGYYFKNGESFDGLNISPENMELFNSIKDDAAEYYNEG